MSRTERIGRVASQMLGEAVPNKDDVLVSEGCVRAVTLCGHLTVADTAHSLGPFQ